MSFDVGRVRALYPALADGYAYLDGAAGTQVPATVVEAIAGAYRAGIGNVGGAFPASGRSEEIAVGERALREFHIGGVHSTIGFHLYMLEDENFLRNQYDLTYIDKLIAEGCQFQRE